MKDKDKEFEKFNKFIEYFEQNHQSIMLEKKTYYEEQLRREKELYEKLHNDKVELKNKFTKERNDLEDLAEAEIDRLKE